MKTIIVLITILTWNGEQKKSGDSVTSMEKCETMAVQLNTPRTDSEIKAESYCLKVRVYE